MQQVIQETPNIPAGSLVGIAGMYAGAVITLQPGEILKLGRDNSNDLIFDQADRISRNHCQIRYIAETGCFQILDYSSNGCFVDGREECMESKWDVLSVSMRCLVARIHIMISSLV